MVAKQVFLFAEFETLSRRARPLDPQEIEGQAGQGFDQLDVVLNPSLREDALIKSKKAAGLCAGLTRFDQPVGERIADGRLEIFYMALKNFPHFEADGFILGADLGTEGKHAATE